MWTRRWTGWSWRPGGRCWWMSRRNSCGGGADWSWPSIPSIPLKPRRGAGLSAVAVGNFSWDWIYAVREARSALAPGDQPVRAGLPPGAPVAEAAVFAGDARICAAWTFPCWRNPVATAAPSWPPRRGADPARRWVLLSFTTLDWSEDAAARRTLETVEFFAVKPLDWPGRRNIHAVDRRRFGGFSDVLASVDAVVTEAGVRHPQRLRGQRQADHCRAGRDFIEYPCWSGS